MIKSNNAYCIWQLQTETKASVITLINRLHILCSSTISRALPFDLIISPREKFLPPIQPAIFTQGRKRHPPLEKTAASWLIM
jgi:hypothetical protein